MKIILATDFSEESQMLYPYAVDLVKDAGGKIILFHAYMDHVFIGDTSFPGSLESGIFNQELLIQIENQSKKQMEIWLAFLEKTIEERQIPNIEVCAVLEGGDPKNELIALSEKENPDLILMGTSGLGLKGFLEGSVSKNIITKVTMPMLSIPKNYQWRESTDVLYATNFGKYEKLTIERIFSILKPYSPTIHVLHLLVDQEDAEKAYELMEALKLSFIGTPIAGDLHFDIVNTQNPRETMKLFCEQHNISMASFIAHRRSLLDYIFRDRVTKEDFYNLGIPMLTFKEPEN